MLTINISIATFKKKKYYKTTKIIFLNKAVKIKVQSDNF
jgi:hypothetical protein